MRHQLRGKFRIQSHLVAGGKTTSQKHNMRDDQKTHSTILIVEDQFFSRVAFRSVLESREDLVIVGEASTGAAGIDLFRQHKPDITIVDLRLPDTTGFDVIRAIRFMDPMAGIVVVSNSEGVDHIRRASEAGASAYLTKDASSSELLQAVSAVLAGKEHVAESTAKRILEDEPGRQLTPRERDVLEQLVLGLPNSDIGFRLGISEKTVRIHMTGILSKLGAEDRTQAVLIALRRGIVDLPTDFIAGKA